MGLVKKIKKAVKKVSKKATGLVSNAVKSVGGTVGSLAKGDIVGAATNFANTATFGLADFTGKNNGIVNVNTGKYLAKAMGAGDLGASGVGSVVVPDLYKKGKSGLVTQLRKGKGNLGGGSYTETAKNPLGGSSGKTGK